MYIDPETVGDNTGLLIVKGNLQVDGTQTTVNSATMTVTDKNIEIAKGAANDAAADGAGITIDSGDGDKTLNWVDATDAWTSSEHIQVAAGKRLGFADDPNTYIDRPAADTIRFTTGGTASVTIDENHKVGIGSDDPDAWLHIQTVSTTGDEDLIKLSRNQYEVGKIRRSAGNMKVSGDGNLYLESDYNADHGATDSNIIFTTDGGEKVRIKSDGKVGIGTVNPQSELHVYKGDASVYTKIESASGASTLELRHTNKYGSLNYYYQGTHKWLFGQINQDSDISLYQPTGVAAGQNAYRIVVKANGNIGIHSTTPTTTLDVRGTVQVSGISTFNSNVNLPDNTKIQIGSKADGDLQIYHDTANSRIVNRTYWLNHQSVTGYKWFNGDATETLIEANVNGPVELYYDGINRLSTSGIGVTVWGQTKTTDLSVTGITTSARLNVTGITTVATLNVGVSGQTLVGINTILDEDNMASDSATALATQQSIKKYIDDRSPAGPGGGNLAVSADSGSNESINLNTEVLDIEGTANEIETATGTNKVVIGLPDDVTIANDLTVASNAGIGSLSVTGVSTFTGNIDANGDLDVDGQTEVDNINVAGVSTFVGVATFTSNHVYIDNKLFVGGIEISPGAAITTPNLDINDYIRHNGDLTTKFGFPTDGKVVTNISGTERISITSAGTYTTGIATATGVINSQTDVQINGTSVLTSALNEAVAMAIALG